MANSKPSSKKSTANASEGNQIIHTFLTSRPLGVLATADTTGMPHAAAIYFSVDDEFNMFFMTKKDTTKYTNLKQNPRAMVVVYEALSQSTVQFRGVAEEIEDVSMAQAAFRGTLHASLQTSDGGIPPIAKLHAGDYVAYKIKPEYIRMAVYSRPGFDQSDFFETIDFTI